jgi:Trk K+ transport system NAD-binding subunit
VGKTLDDLDLHRQFDVEIVGLLDLSAPDGQPRVLFSSWLAGTTALEAGDAILVYGQEAKLEELERAVTQL